MSWPRIIQALPPCLCLNRHRRNMVLLEVLALYSSKRNKNTIVPYSNRYPLPIINTSKPKIPLKHRKDNVTLRSCTEYRAWMRWRTFPNAEKLCAKKIVSRLNESVHTVPTRGNRNPAPTLARTSRIGKTNPGKENNDLNMNILKT